MDLVASCTSSTTTSFSAETVSPGSPAGEGPAGGAHQLRGVELVGAGAAHHLQVFGGEVRGGDPLRMPVLQSERAQPVRGDAVFAGAHHQFAQFGAESAQPAHVRAERFRPGRPGAVGEMAGEQVAEVAVLVGPREQPRRGAAGGPPVVSDDVERDRVDGAGQRPTGGDPESFRERVAQAGSPSTWRR